MKGCMTRPGQGYHHPHLPWFPPLWQCVFQHPVSQFVLSRLALAGLLCVLWRRWRPERVVKVPRSAYFTDYSALAFRGSKVAVLSQENAAVWVRRLVVSPLHNPACTAATGPCSIWVAPAWRGAPDSMGPSLVGLIAGVGQPWSGICSSCQEILVRYADWRF